MLTNFIANSATVLRHLQSSVWDAVTSHPMLVVAGIGGGLALFGAVWLVVLEAELRQLRAQMADRGRVIAFRR